jgi:flagellar hook-basal body complex protein FliE
MTPIQSFAAPPAAPSLALPSLAPPTSGTPSTGQTPFRNILLEALDQVNSMQQQADAAVEQLVTGGDVNPAEVLTTLQKADMSFKLMLQIRNKLVAAYQEVNNIRI